jgi:hypothetical protein
MSRHVRNDERLEDMFAKALILPISTVTLLAASQFASAQSIQPISPCPPGKVAAMNHNRRTETANITEERRKAGDKPRLANNYDSGGGNTQTAPVTGKPIDPMDCR